MATTPHRRPLPSNVEIRPATPAEMPEFVRIASRELAVTTASVAGVDPRASLCAFEDGRLVTTYAWWPLQVRFNGPAVSVPGVTCVSTHPSARMKGYLRAVVERHFDHLHESGEASMTLLHPAWAAIYERYGYATVTDRVTYRFDPRDIAFHHPVPITGRLREVDLSQEFGLLVEVYRRYRDDRTGLIHRGRAMWEAGELEIPAGLRQTVIAYEEAGEPLGYVVYVHGPRPSGVIVNGGGQIMRVMDFVALSPAAHQALWGVIGGYANVSEVEWGNAPPDDPLPLMLVEPRRLNLSRRDGIMARLVTVSEALPLRPYTEAAGLRFSLVDPVCPWNEGRWLLETSSEGARVTSAEGASPDITLTVDTLARLAFGYTTASVAAQAGLLDVHDASALPRWDAAMRTKHPPHEQEHTW
ncbi:MAG: GNAT family N-acetyltransferase [Dehalococcoidia bacterium]|nr:MAG: GNAT family N-acetyltransferase [Dehalococcoidia bacterium]